MVQLNMGKQHNLKILSFISAYSSDTWKRLVRPFKLPTVNSPIIRKLVPGRLLRALECIKQALALFFASRHYDLAVVPGSGSGLILGILQSLLRRKSRAVPIIYIDCLYYDYKNPLRRLWKKTQLKLAAGDKTRFVCWSRRETTNYSRCFGLPEKSFVYLPYYNTLETEEKYAVEGDFIFSGGNSDRDYKTLIRAVEDIDVKVVIATQTTDWITPRIASITNVEIRPMPYEEYTKCMKECLVNVIVLQKDLLRSAGQQTFINSMYLGKPTVICDNGECLDYIEDGENAFFVPSGDFGLLAKCLASLIENQDLRQKISRQSALTASAYTYENTIAQILELGEKLTS
ncbi:MAG: glycosyltransferase [FCB group bacterium]|nr:glycosyltransferase [FCB group bacterium]